MASLEHSGYTWGHIRLFKGMKNTLHVQHYIMQLLLYISCLYYYLHVLAGC